MLIFVFVMVQITGLVGWEHLPEIRVEKRKYISSYVYSFPLALIYKYRKKYVCLILSLVCMIKYDIHTIQKYPNC